MFFQLKKLENMLKLYCFLFEENNKMKIFFSPFKSIFFIYYYFERENSNLIIYL
jgi:hypothetical protein